MYLCLHGFMSALIFCGLLKFQIFEPTTNLPLYMYIKMNGRFSYHFTEGEDRQRRLIGGDLGPVSGVNDKLHIRKLLNHLQNEVLISTAPVEKKNSCCR